MYCPIRASSDRPDLPDRLRVRPDRLRVLPDRLLVLPDRLLARPDRLLVRPDRLMARPDLRIPDAVANLTDRDGDHTLPSLKRKNGQAFAAMRAPFFCSFRCADFASQALAYGGSDGTPIAWIGSITN